MDPKSSEIAPSSGLVAIAFETDEAFAKYLDTYLARRPRQYLASPGRKNLIVP